MDQHEPPAKIIRSYSSLEWVAAALAIFTIISIPLKSLFTETRQLHENSDVSKLFGDTSMRGGASYGEFIDPENLEFLCHLVRAEYPNPFCGYSMRFIEKVEAGLDLSKYESLIIDIDYKGDAKSLKIYVLNYNSAYSNPEEFRSSKFNMIEFEPGLLETRFTVELSDFKVADWWRAKHKIAFAYSKPEFSNVSTLQVQTGSKSPPGEHYFKVKGIYVHRQIIPNEEFYFGLIIIWVTTALVFLGRRIYLQNTVILNQRLKTKVLQEEKKALDKVAEHLDKQAKTDMLTQVLNRAGLKQHISAAFLRFKEDSQRFSFLLMDIDYFKKVNDDHGHDVGDQTLRELADFVKSNIRGGDIFGRWGGEEFLLLCHHCDVRAAEYLANKLCRAINNHSFSSKLPMTCSFGVATVVDGDDSAALFKAADRALYVAKSAGRNQVKVADRA